MISPKYSHLISRTFNNNHANYSRAYKHENGITAFFYDLFKRFFEDKNNPRLEIKQRQAHQLATAIQKNIIDKDLNSLKIGDKHEVFSSDDAKLYLKKVKLSPEAGSIEKEYFILTKVDTQPPISKLLFHSSQEEDLFIFSCDKNDTNYKNLQKSTEAYLDYNLNLFGSYIKPPTLPNDMVAPANESDIPKGVQNVMVAPVNESNIPKGEFTIVFHGSHMDDESGGSMSQLSELSEVGKVLSYSGCSDDLGLEYTEIAEKACKDIAAKEFPAGTIINIAGYSRGSLLPIYIATKFPQYKFNMLIVDPIKGPVTNKALDNTIVPENVINCRVYYSEYPMFGRLTDASIITVRNPDVTNLKVTTVLGTDHGNIQGYAIRDLPAFMKNEPVKSGISIETHAENINTMRKTILEKYNKMLVFQNSLIALPDDIVENNQIQANTPISYLNEIYLDVFRSVDKTFKNAALDSELCNVLYEYDHRAPSEFNAERYCQKLLKLLNTEIKADETHDCYQPNRNLILQASLASKPSSPAVINMVRRI